MMNTRGAFFHGLQIGRLQWRAVAIVHFFQLCLALTLGVQVFHVLESSIGNSLEINKLLKSYNHTVISDFLKVHGASITPLIGQLRWLLLVWLVFSVFIDGGLLFCASTGRPGARDFWKGGAAHFFPFLKISLLFLLFAVAWAAVALVPLALFFEPSLQYFSSEKYPVWIAVFLFIVFGLGLAVLFVWSVVARFQKIRTGAPLFSCLENGWQVFKKNRARLFGLWAGFVALQLALVAVYWAFEAFTGMVTPFLIVLLFLVQQLFVFLRIMLRQMMYAAIFQAVATNDAP